MVKVQNARTPVYAFWVSDQTLHESKAFPSPYTDQESAGFSPLSLLTGDLALASGDADLVVGGEDGAEGGEVACSGSPEASSPASALHIMLVPLLAE